MPCILSSTLFREDINAVIEEVKHMYGGHFHGKLFSEITKDIRAVILRDLPGRLRMTVSGFAFVCESRMKRCKKFSFVQLFSLFFWAVRYKLHACSVFLVLPSVVGRVCTSAAFVFLLLLVSRGVSSPALDLSLSLSLSLSYCLCQAW